MVSSSSHRDESHELDRLQWGRLEDWLQLVRLPTVFTLLSNCLAAVAVAGGNWLPLSGLIPVLLASLAAYWAGMILNDVVDVEDDRRDRPNRPLAAGRVSVAIANQVATALLLICPLLVLGTTALHTSQPLWQGAAFAAAVGLSLCVRAYDSSLKKTVLGPILMGSCRALNILMVGLTMLAVTPIGLSDNSSNPDGQRRRPKDQSERPEQLREGGRAAPGAMRVPPGGYRLTPVSLQQGGDPSPLLPPPMDARDGQGSAAQGTNVHAPSGLDRAAAPGSARGSAPGTATQGTATSGTGNPSRSPFSLGQGRDEPRRKPAGMEAERPPALTGGQIAEALFGEQEVASVPAQPFPMTLLYFALAIGVYIVGVTVFARSEEERSSDSAQLGFGLVLQIAGLIIIALLPRWFRRVDTPWVLHPSQGYPLLIGLIGMTVGNRAVQAISHPVSRKVQLAVKHALLTLILIDAAVVLMWLGPWYGCAVVALLIPAMYSAIAVRMT